MSLSNSLSVSNLVCPKNETREFFEKAASVGYNGIELVPLKYFDSWEEAFKKSRELKTVLSDLGLSVPSVQGITYGVEGLSFFGEGRQKFIDHLDRVADFAADLGARNMVLGAPGLRVRSGDYSITRLADFFEELSATILVVDVSIEPNPPRYRGEFFLTTDEVLAFMGFFMSQSRSNLLIQFDLGTILDNQESRDTMVMALCSCEHVHVSEIALNKIQKHDGVRELFQKHLRQHLWVSAEMKETLEWRTWIEDAYHIMRGYLE